MSLSITCRTKLNLDEQGFNEAKNIAKGLLPNQPSSRRALRALSRALLAYGALSWPDVHAVIAEAETETVRRATTMARAD